MKALDLCSHDFSTSCRTVKISSAQLLPFLNPHYDSGIFLRTLATTFPATFSRDIARQLSQLLRSSFLWMGTRIALHQSLGTLWLGLDKICLAKFEQNGQPKERSNSASKMGCQFCQKSKMGKEGAFEFLDCMALVTSC